VHLVRSSGEIIQDRAPCMIASCKGTGCSMSFLGSMSSRLCLLSSPRCCIWIQYRKTYGYWKLSNNKQQIRNDITTMMKDLRPLAATTQGIKASIAAATKASIAMLSKASFATVRCSYNICGRHKVKSCCAVFRALIKGIHIGSFTLLLLLAINRCPEPKGSTKLRLGLSHFLPLPSRLLLVLRATETMVPRLRRKMRQCD
jgi:hypothetical protein